MCESRNFYLFLLQFFALLGLLAFLLWLGLRPKHPTYTIVDFSVPTSNGSNTTSSIDLGSENGVIFYTLEIQNPNKDSGVFYDDILLSFFNGQDTVGEKTLTSFHQGRDKTRQLSDRIDVKAQAWRGFRNAISNATAQLKVNLVTKIRYRTWGHMSKHHGMKMQGQIPIGSDGKISGKKKKIKLRHASKKWTSRRLA